MKQLRRKYSLRLERQDCLVRDAELTDPTAATICACNPSRRSRSRGPTRSPARSSTNSRVGKRSNTPDMIRCHSARLAREADSMTNISVRDRVLADSSGMPLPPEWCVTGSSSSSHTAHSGSYSASNSGSIHGDVGRDAGQQHAAQAVVLGPADVVDGVVDVVEEDLREPGAPAPGAR